MCAVSMALSRRRSGAVGGRRAVHLRPERRRAHHLARAQPVAAARARRYRQAVLADNAARSAGRYAAFSGLDLDSAHANALWPVIANRGRSSMPPLLSSSGVRACRESPNRCRSSSRLGSPAARRWSPRRAVRSRQVGDVVGGHSTVPLRDVARPRGANGVAGRCRPDADAGHPGRHGHRRGLPGRPATSAPSSRASSPIPSC